MKRALLSRCVFVLLGSTLLTVAAQAQVLVASWTFDSLGAAPNTPLTMAASYGTGTLYGDGTNGSSLFVATTAGNEWTAFGGTTTLDPRPGLVAGTATAGNALAVVAGTGLSANGKSLTFGVSLTGYQSPTLSFALRGTATGFNSELWSYSTDAGSNWTSFWSNTADNTAAWVSRTTTISDGSLDNASSVLFRVTFAGATATAGNNRLDNVTVSAIPEPSTYALLFGAVTFGFVALRRRFTR